MGIDFLWDTNIVIYYLQKQLPPVSEVLVDDIALQNQTAISVITEIELLCWHLSSPGDLHVLTDFTTRSVIYPLDDKVKLKAIEVRKKFKLKLPDAIIAATALVNDHTLISRNSSDFKKIPELKLYNPFDYQV